MAERYANNATSTLNGSITAASTTLTVNSATDFPTAGQFRILIDNEILVVTAVEGNIFTVQRGAEGTVAAAHNENATVEHVLTKFSLVGTQGLDARQFGATGDGTTDDTAALQAALDALAAGDHGELFIPAGTYKLTSALSIPVMDYKTIRGADWGATFLRQYTNNVPVIETAGQSMGGVTVRDLQLVYNTQQLSTDTAGIALAFNSPVDATSGWYHWRVENIRIHQANTGIGLVGPDRLTVWNSLFEKIWMTRISQSAISFNPPTPIGMPVNVFRMIFINNAGSSVVSSGPAITMQAAEAQFDGLDIEGWYNKLITVSGGVPVAIRGLHVEHHVIDATNPILESSNGPLTIEDANFDFEVTSAAVATVARVGSGGFVGLRRARITPVITSGSVVGISYASDAAGSDVSEIIDVGSNTSFPLGPNVYVGPFHPMIAASNSISANANQVILTAFSVQQTVRVTKGVVEVGGTSSGNLDVGIYNDAGTLLASSGSTAMAAANTRQELTLSSSVLLNPGRKYYAAVNVDNATGTLRGYVVGGTLFQLGNIGTRVNATYPLPSSISIAGAGYATKMYAIIFTP